MRLYICGKWIGKGGIYEARIKSVSFLEDIKRLSLKDFPYFLLVSYHVASQTLKLPIKSSLLPSVVVIKIDDLKPVKPESKRIPLKFLGSSLSDKDFINGILRVKRFIEKGEIYQLNLTNAFHFESGGDTLDLFFNFYRRQPVDYAFFFDATEFYIISGSMELFLERKGRKLKSEPIKGTSSSKKALERSEKDRAENLMITDVVRNDLGTVGKNIEVRELFAIRKYRTLYHMYSTVECKTSASLIDILFATFPPASVTGAPKRKAVEIIDMLEPHERSFYCGCAGFLRAEDDFTLSVLIRTAVGRENILTYYSGCGIVWDSDPKKELKELYLKLKAFAPHLFTP
ncbi:chorismate-binding protein [Hydrogenobacter thermophilus]|uniref:chorismate-binding protein n=1 Tax=Hydrogenobacter thermophilus TaxID=940 RepID=UPI0030FD037F